MQRLSAAQASILLPNPKTASYPLENDAARMSRARPHTRRSRRPSSLLPRAGTPRDTLYLNLATVRRAALHVINERAQLRQDLPAAGIAEKHPRKHRRVWLPARAPVLLLSTLRRPSARVAAQGPCLRSPRQAWSENRWRSADRIRRFRSRCPLTLNDHGASAPLDRRHRRHACWRRSSVSTGRPALR